ncbi:serine O-acetyltransferase [Lolliginicoccus suaedae]|uniref:serine O-acetyltransferase n=1 Tax=Lolliginicoccus suaedae TaxID=2605429 RepID=UPI001658D155|nr:DapH/DapD/GlmU-related protein [Lolliginicoccus suaedae]
MADLAAHLSADLARYADGHRLSLPRALKVLLANPGARASLLLRLQESSALSKSGGWRKLLRQVTLLLTGADFVPGCRIGPGLMMQHPNGIVISGRAIIGAGATILQQVTVGEAIGSDGAAPRAPRIGDGVLLGAGCKVLGGVEVGDGAAVGANAVVLQAVPAGAVAVGVPARIIPARRGAGA